MVIEQQQFLVVGESLAKRIMDISTGVDGMPTQSCREQIRTTARDVVVTHWNLCLQMVHLTKIVSGLSFPSELLPAPPHA